MEPLKPLNVFWIDDEHDEPAMLNFKVQAEQYGITLHPFKSAQEGLPVLEARLEFFDAVLFDALFFLRQTQANGTEKLDGLREAMRRVDQLAGRKAFKPFILTGQERLESSEDFKDTYGEFYSKRDPKAVQRLFKDMRLAAEAMADTQLRHRFQRVFEVCTERYIGEAAAGELMSILRRENDEAFAHDAVTHINAIRKIVEDLFRACARENLLPDHFVTGGVKLNGASKFLSGVPEDGFQVAKGVVPDTITQLFKNILAVAQPASHRAQVDAHMNAVRTPYLLYSITYMLLDVLLWFKSFADEQAGNRDRVLYTRIVGASTPVATGSIEQDERRNFHCGDILLGYKYTETNFKLGDTIEVQAVEDNLDARSSSIYPRKATRFCKA